MWKHNLLVRDNKKDVFHINIDGGAGCCCLMGSNRFFFQFNQDQTPQFHQPHLIQALIPLPLLCAHQAPLEQQQQCTTLQIYRPHILPPLQPKYTYLGLQYMSNCHQMAIIRLLGSSLQIQIVFRFFWTKNKQKTNQTLIFNFFSYFCVVIYWYYYLF